MGAGIPSSLRSRSTTSSVTPFAASAATSAATSTAGALPPDVALCVAAAEEGALFFTCAFWIPQQVFGMRVRWFSCSHALAIELGTGYTPRGPVVSRARAHGEFVEEGGPVVQQRHVALHVRGQDAVHDNLTHAPELRRAQTLQDVRLVLQTPKSSVFTNTQASTTPAPKSGIVQFHKRMQRALLDE